MNKETISGIQGGLLIVSCALLVIFLLALISTGIYELIF